MLLNRLIVSNIKVCVYIIYVCVVYCISIYIHTKQYLKKYLNDAKITVRVVIVLLNYWIELKISEGQVHIWVHSADENIGEFLVYPNIMMWPFMQNAILWFVLWWQHLKCWQTQDGGRVSGAAECGITLNVI